MSLKESIGQVMAEIGPLADLYMVDAYPEDDLWHLVVDEDTEVFAELAESRGILVLSTDLGTPEGDRTQLYELLLRYAYVWHVTDGLRLALNDADGSVQLIRDCSARDITVIELNQQVADFVEKARAWREIVANHHKRPPEQERVEALLDPSFLRG